MERKKFSYRIACFKIDKGTKSLVIIKRKASYHYTEVIALGREITFKKYCMMTNHEKDVLSTLNFKLMWIYLFGATFDPKAYAYAKHVYEEKNKDVIEKYTKLVTPICETNLYQLPGGRKRSSKESDIKCAMREFKEETGITEDKYILYPDAVFTLSNTEEGVKYIMTYFVAALIDPDIKYITDSHEIEDVKDLTLEQIKILSQVGGKNNKLFLDPALEAFKLINKIFKFKLT